MFVSFTCSTVESLLRNFEKIKPAPNLQRVKDSAFRVEICPDEENKCYQKQFVLDNIWQKCHSH